MRFAPAYATSLSYLTPAITFNTPTTTMAPPYHNSWRPNQNNSSAKAPRNQNWQDEMHRADDQIAPSGVSGSTDHLQRWALVTAGMPQQPPLRPRSRAHEDDMKERIQRRYEGSHASRYRPSPPPPQSVSTRAPEHESVVTNLTDDDLASPVEIHAMKRRRSRLASPARDASRTGLSAATYMRSLKRRRSRTPSPRRAADSAITTRSHQAGTSRPTGNDDEYDFAQSSGWSFPSNQDREDEKR
ncbi:hypothetical protein EJ02DRAFT_238685 [Clathrospora elynae]|uniref:Uncharacterized protein n=1 Tax=Clathrospora elynae TaxID=706981 RepID=A0A6A5SK79_9PLEO|nr:hypothetical protein EJ02DRAFT_238685 [Clathrospora elynae]